MTRGGIRHRPEGRARKRTEGTKGKEKAKMKSAGSRSEKENGGMIKKKKKKMKTAGAQKSNGARKRTEGKRERKNKRN